METQAAIDVSASNSAAERRSRKLRRACVPSLRESRRQNPRCNLRNALELRCQSRRKCTKCSTKGFARRKQSRTSWNGNLRKSNGLLQPFWKQERESGKD